MTSGVRVWFECNNDDQIRQLTTRLGIHLVALGMIDELMRIAFFICFFNKFVKPTFLSPEDMKTCMDHLHLVLQSVRI